MPGQAGDTSRVSPSDRTRHTRLSLAAGACRWRRRARVPSSSRQGTGLPHPRRYGGASRIPKPIRGGGMNTRVAPLGLLGLSLLVAGVAAARAHAPETVFALRHWQRAPTWQSAYVRGIVPETVDRSRDAQVQASLEDGRPFITEHGTLPSRPHTRHPVRWWRVHSTLSGISRQAKKRGSGSAKDSLPHDMNIAPVREGFVHVYAYRSTGSHREQLKPFRPPPSPHSRLRILASVKLAVSGWSDGQRAAHSHERNTG
jgi:hypothetical protein